MSEKNIVIQLNLQESSLVLQALAERPFKQVFAVIGTLNHQAQQFFQPPVASENAVNFVLTASECSLCVKSLGELPYNQVQALLANLHRQLLAQQVGVD